MTEGALKEIELVWLGPFTWFGKGGESIFAGPGREVPGVYVWTVPVGGSQRVFYVGQTQAGLAHRHHDHFREYFGGAYSIYEPSAFRRGSLEKLYHGYAYKKPRWQRATPFHERFPDLVRPLVEHLEVMRIYITRLDASARVQRRVESALMQVVYNIPGEAGQLLEPGLRRHPRRDDEEPIHVFLKPVGLLEGVSDQFAA
jgi:hypothetical protein